jgi:hypothetical protein
MLTPGNDDFSNLTVFLDIDDYVRVEGRVAVEDVVQFLEMIFHVTPDGRRDFHMSARVFKFHQSSPSSNGVNLVIM